MRQKALQFLLTNKVTISGLTLVFLAFLFDNGHTLTREVATVVNGETVLHGFDRFHFIDKALGYSSLFDSTSQGVKITMTYDRKPIVSLLQAIGVALIVSGIVKKD